MDHSPGNSTEPSPGINKVETSVGISGKKDDARQKYVEAKRAYRLDHFPEAVTLLNEAAELDPSNEVVTKLLEKMNKLAHFTVDSRKDFLSGKYASAKSKVLRCKQLMDDIEFPNKLLESKFELKLSLIAFREGDKTEAMTCVNKSLQLNDSYINGLLHRAHLHKLNRDWEKTLIDLEKAEQNDSHLTRKPYKAWITEAQVHARRMRKRLNSA